MDKFHRWLQNEIPQWESDGLITGDQGQALRQRYPARESGQSGTVIFGSVGAVIFGLGVVLLVAFNWHEIGKAGKLALIFGALAGAHAGGLALQRRSDWRRHLGTVLHLLGSMMFGAGIWLVAQIYHIEEHYPTGFLIWGLGALALAWALPSVMQGLLATATLTVWGGSEVFNFNSHHPWSIVLILVGIAPLAWHRKSGSLLSVAIVAVTLLGAFNLGRFGSGAQVAMSYLAFGAFLVAAGCLARGRNGMAGVAAALNFLGFLIFLGCDYLVTFRWGMQYALTWDMRWSASPTVGVPYCWTLFGAALAGWTLVLVRALTRRIARPSPEMWLVPVALAYAYALIWGHYGFVAWFGAWPFNLALIGIAAGWMWRGARGGPLRHTIMGILLMSAVVAARYFDLFPSLAARGFAFVVLGALMFGAIWLHRWVPRGRAEPEVAP